MRVVLPTEYRFYQTSDGHVWTNQLQSYSFFKRYLSVFDQVIIISRVKKISSDTSGLKRVDGEGVSVVALPYYIGPFGFIFTALKIRLILKQNILREDAVILRLPSIIGSMAANVLIKKKQPFAISVVGDPYDAFSPGTFKNLFLPIIRYIFVKNLKKECLAAAALNYVAEKALQKRYPPKKNGRQFISIFSDVELPVSAYKKRIISYKGGDFKLITIGSMENNHKGIDLLIQASAQCQKKFPFISINIIGDGREKEKLEKLAKKLDVHNITFNGQMPHNRHFYQLLDNSHLFVLPSRAEGLPRALLEAMARSLPCISTKVGGIPELLPKTELVRPSDVSALADKIINVIENPLALSRMSVFNYQRSLKYKNKYCEKKQISFYQRIKSITAQNILK